MAVFVLDASIAVSWCFPGDPTEDTVYSRSILSLLATQEALVPEVWAFEIANSLYVSFEKRKRISDEQISEFLSRLKALPITVEIRDLWTNVDLEAQARKWKLAAYDAAYLDLAMRKGLPLATADEDLRRVASAQNVVVVTA
jgi:predicted nucleic acid-binding protein